MSRIREIEKLGQSIWFDYIQRSMIWTGALHRMMEEDGLKGVTSNPSIFEKAIGGSRDYEAALRAFVRAGASAGEAFETLAIEDIQLACDVLSKVHEETKGKDGYVSLEVSPHLAFDTVATIEEALRLWESVGRDNLMIKVPGTREGLPAVEQLIAEGVNVNITLLFAVERYEEVHEAYMRGLEKLVERGGDPARVASVASFFVSRIDSLVDKMIDERLSAKPPPAIVRTLEGLRGKIAVANAKLAYRSYQATIGSSRWRALRARGARVQRLLWASTSTKNPSYRDVLYLEELIGPDTVNTVPEATFHAFNDHGNARETLTKGLDEAEATMRALGEADLSMKAVTDKLVEQGVVLFADAFDRLMATVEKKRVEILGDRLVRTAYTLGSYEGAVAAKLEALSGSGFVRRLWSRDGALFGASEADHEHASGFMGWLDVVDAMQHQVDPLLDLEDEIAEDGIESVVLMGMGGSSLAPDVFRRTFGQLDGSPELFVLDSTVPAQIARIEAELDLKKTLFIVASKSGTTTEPNAFDSYFYDKLKDGDHFVAITDPGSALEQIALERGYRAIYSGDPEIGGRFSALSPFGLVPAATMGLDVVDLLERARLMVGSSGPSVPADVNPGVRMGGLLGVLAERGRDKLTLVSSPGLSAFGAWLEQLVAESTGKAGKGVVPVDGEALGSPEAYGDDRVFVSFEYEGDGAVVASSRLDALAAAGHPVIRVRLSDRRDLVQEMFRWEVATAVIGHILGVNPFDQPNVQESKDFTKKLLSARDRSGKLPPVEGEERLLEANGVVAYTDGAGAKVLGGARSLEETLAKHLGRGVAGDYVAINAFIDMNEAHAEALQRIRHAIRARTKLATTVGYGPRFLHSTGQLHKGGPDKIVVLHITAEDAVDREIPGAGYGFGALKRAQEAGDFLALSRRGRRILRLHLPKDPAKGLDAIARAIG